LAGVAPVFPFLLFFGGARDTFVRSALLVGNPTLAYAQSQPFVKGHFAHTARIAIFANPWWIYLPTVTAAPLVRNVIGNATVRLYATSHNDLLFGRCVSGVPSELTTAEANPIVVSDSQATGIERALDVPIPAFLALVHPFPLSHNLRRDEWWWGRWCNRCGGGDDRHSGRGDVSLTR